MKSHELSAINISKSYNQRRVVDSVSLLARSGEVVGLLGPNGAGKTTSFYICVGLTAPDAGQVLIDGQDVTAEPMYERARLGLGYLPQEPSVFRKLTVEQNILAILETMPFGSPEDRDARLEELLGELSLEKVRHSMASALSGGERRRVEITRALARSPNFILLDEPFAGIDPIAIQDIQQIVIRLRTKGIGILITDHNVRETLRICDRAYIIVDGRVLIEGPPETITSNELAQRHYLGNTFAA